MNKKEIVLFWSGGKDSALALYELQRKNEFSIKALLTTITKDSNTVAYHGISETLLVEQSKLIGIPLQRVYLPENCSNQEYNSIIQQALTPYINRGITDVAFGDLHLEDIRKYREIQLGKIGITTHFPLWEYSVHELMDIFFQQNFRAIITSTMTTMLDHTYLGKELSSKIIATLPKEVDPFGENGEFHTLVTFAPYFKFRLQTSISVTKEEGPYQVCQVRCP